MVFYHLIFLVIVSILSSFSPVQSQQPYIRRSYTNCSVTDASTSVLGYSCNGQSSSCQSYLIFRSQPPYNSVSSISSLLSSNRIELADINGVTVNSTFETNTEVIVPVSCSCLGDYYQANTSYVTQTGDGYFLIANNTFQGLSTCHALLNQTPVSATRLFGGTRITVPLRCACPTRNQTNDGVRYLLSYLVTWGDFVSSISQRFGVDTESTLEANGLSDQDANVYPFTTLLIPLQNPPNSQNITPSQPPPPPPQQPSSPPSNGKKNTWVFILIGVLAGVGLLSIVSITVFCLFFRKKPRTKTGSAEKKIDSVLDSTSYDNYTKTTGRSIEESELSEDFLESVSDIAQSLKIYKFHELQAATDNFSPKCFIKGSVYRGKINGDLAAIKRTNKDVAKEIGILNKINHSNLVRLSGVSVNEGFWYLVFEYVENGSLTDWIYYDGGSSKKVLSWTERIQIASDVASGLNYLHSYTNPPHVHKDVKTSNVLLDSDFRAKIANFSLARSADGEEGEFALTRHIIGTKGYMAPEYLENGYISPKLDVYSFGIVMLEIFTGKEIGVAKGAGEYLPQALKTILEGENPKEKIIGFVDPTLYGDYPLDLALVWARLIDSCLKTDPAARPTMDDVVQNLSNILITMNLEGSTEHFGNNS
ncbi:lysM domain receptor-like kinase 4 [Ranunculus cassubicifolius]